MLTEFFTALKPLETWFKEKNTNQ